MIPTHALWITRYLTTGWSSVHPHCICMHIHWYTYGNHLGFLVLLLHILQFTGWEQGQSQVLHNLLGHMWYALVLWSLPSPETLWLPDSDTSIYHLNGSKSEMLHPDSSATLWLEKTLTALPVAHSLTALITSSSSIIRLSLCSMLASAESDMSLKPFVWNTSCQRKNTNTSNNTGQSSNLVVYSKLPYWFQLCLCSRVMLIVTAADCTGRPSRTWNLSLGRRVRYQFTKEVTSLARPVRTLPAQLHSATFTSFSWYAPN